MHTCYYKQLTDRIKAQGGLFNAHLHLDRSGTIHLDEGTAATKGRSTDYRLSLAEKHQQFLDIHNSSHFTPDNLRDRINGFLDTMVEVGTRRADTLVDVRPDTVGLSNLEILLEIKQQRRHEIDFRAASYTPMGFRDTEPQLWNLFVEGAKIADFIGSLPERDDRNRYPDHIGFYQHCLRILELSQELNKPVQVHLDQHNDPREHETEIFLKAVEETGYSAKGSTEPLIWLVHFISPSHYQENRRRELLSRLADFNFGIICCPSAALSMRQLRFLNSPTGNSIAPVLECLAAGIPVRLGSDNIADNLLPAGTPDLTAELFVLSNALRFYDIEILARLASATPLTDA